MMETCQKSANATTIFPGAFRTFLVFIHGKWLYPQKMLKLSLTILFQFFVLLAFAQQNLIPYVHPLIGTEKMGHTFPGATVPFGSVQLSPDTDTLSYEINGKYNGDAYKYCAGYKYEDKTIVGFSHTHFSGTGHSDLGDFLIMPTQGALQINPGVASNPKSGYRSAFSHANEVAEAGYYKLKYYGLKTHRLKEAAKAIGSLGLSPLKLYT